MWYRKVPCAEKWSGANRVRKSQVTEEATTANSHLILEEVVNFFEKRECTGYPARIGDPGFRSVFDLNCRQSKKYRLID